MIGLKPTHFMLIPELPNKLKDKARYVPGIVHFHEGSKTRTEEWGLAVVDLEVQEEYDCMLVYRILLRENYAYGG